MPDMVTVMCLCRYSVGEKLDINCSSAATLPHANLTWYINQKLVGYTIYMIYYLSLPLIH